MCSSWQVSRMNLPISATLSATGNACCFSRHSGIPREEDRCSSMIRGKLCQEYRNLRDAFWWEETLRERRRRRKTLRGRRRDEDRMGSMERTNQPRMDTNRKIPTSDLTGTEAVVGTSKPSHHVLLFPNSRPFASIRGSISLMESPCFGGVRRVLRAGHWLLIRGAAWKATLPIELRAVLALRIGLRTSRPRSQVPLPSFASASSYNSPNSSNSRFPPPLFRAASSPQ
jgi:hypothetical protein